MNSKEKAKRIIRGFYPILDVSYSPDVEPFKLAEDILSSGVEIFQLRQKNLSKEDFLSLAMKIAYLRVHNKFHLIINHFVDVAKEIQADGVHLGSTSESIGKVRETLGSDVIIGSSVHSIEEGIEKEKEGADYITFGAIYQTKTKDKNHPIQGIEKLRKLVCEVSIPVVAIGGIIPERVKEIFESRTAAFSSITAISHDKRPQLVAKDFQNLWQ